MTLSEEDLINIDEFRCPECFTIPFMGIEYSENETFLQFNCLNDHKKNMPLSELYIQSKFNKLYFQFCSICKEKIESNNNFYCLKCYQIFCNKCKEIHYNSLFHPIILFNNLDSKCVSHLENNLIGYCPLENENVCEKCLNSKGLYKDKNVLKNILFDKNEIEMYQNKINKAEKSLEGICLKFQEIFLALKNTIEYISSSFIKYFEINQTQINFCKELLNIYLVHKNKFQLNFQIIENVKKIINFNDINVLNELNYFIHKTERLSFEIINFLSNNNNYFLKNSSLDKNDNFDAFSSNLSNLNLDNEKNKINNNNNNTNHEEDFIEKLSDITNIKSLSKDITLKKIDEKFNLNESTNQNIDMTSNILKSIKTIDEFISNISKQSITINYDINIFNNNIDSSNLNNNNKFIILLNTLKLNKSGNNSLVILNDGRFASASNDKSIKIYNNNFTIDFEIKEHKNSVTNLKLLKDGTLVSASKDKIIFLYKIKNNKYKIIDKLEGHEDLVVKIIQLKNENLLSISYDNSLKIWKKENDKYKEIKNIKCDDCILDIIEYDYDKIAFSCINKSIYFYNLIEDKYIKKINNIKCNIWNNTLCLINNILIVGGLKSIYFINLNDYSIYFELKNINFWSFLKLDDDIIITGNENDIIKWKFKDNKLIFISKYENAHQKSIRSIIKFDNYILTCSEDKTIKIWKNF